VNSVPRQPRNCRADGYFVKCAAPPLGEPIDNSNTARLQKLRVASVHLISHSTIRQFNNSPIHQLVILLLQPDGRAQQEVKDVGQVYQEEAVVHQAVGQDVAEGAGQAHGNGPPRPFYLGRQRP
jgi:hypothetical protein